MDLYFEGEGSSLGQLSSSNRDMDIEMGGNDAFAESPAEYLHFIAFKCGTKVLQSIYILMNPCLPIDVHMFTDYNIEIVWLEQAVGCPKYDL